jgi:hypothetical protein
MSFACPSFSGCYRTSRITNPKITIGSVDIALENFDIDVPADVCFTGVDGEVVVPAPAAGDSIFAGFVFAEAVLIEAVPVVDRIESPNSGAETDDVTAFSDKFRSHRNRLSKLTQIIPASQHVTPHVTGGAAQSVYDLQICAPFSVAQDDPTGQHPPSGHAVWLAEYIPSVVHAPPVLQHPLFEHGV